MCGRYVAAKGVASLATEFEIARPVPAEQLSPSYNVAPTDEVYVVTLDHGQRRLETMRWGLVPFWAKDPSIGSRMINARAETVSEKPAFRRAFRTRRCLVPADGYYEWEPRRVEGELVKQPWLIRPRDGSSIAMAGVYEIWHAPGSDAKLLTTAIITTSAPDDHGQIHDRAPLMVAREGWESWLDPEFHGDPMAFALPAVPGPLESFEVDRKVNSVQNNGPELIRPLG